MISFYLHQKKVSASSSTPPHESRGRLLSLYYEADGDDSKNYSDHSYYGDHSDGYI